MAASEERDVYNFFVNISGKKNLPKVHDKKDNRTVSLNVIRASAVLCSLEYVSVACPKSTTKRTAELFQLMSFERVSFYVAWYMFL